MIRSASGTWSANFTDTVQEVWVTIDDYTGPDPEPDDSFILSNPVVTGGKKVFSKTALNRLKVSGIGRRQQ